MRTLLRNAQILSGCGAIALLLAVPAGATDVIEIEEHWQLHVGGPDANRSAPQVSMTMSPYSHLDCEFFIVTLNHRSYPDFTAGGVQVQRWNGEKCKAAVHLSNSQSLHHDSETVNWTQKLSVADGVLTFEVIDGASQSWGSFGDNDTLKIQIESNLTRLNDYKPVTSFRESGISYAGNRVSSLILNKLRWKTDDGEYHQMVAPIDIHSELDD